MTKKQAIDYAAALSDDAHALQIERDAVTALLEEHEEDEPETEIGSLPGSPPPPPPSRPPL